MKFILLFFLSFIYSISTYSQTIIWGAGGAIGATHGEFSIDFGTPGTWQATSIFDQGGSRTPGNALWTRTTNGKSQGAYSLNDPAISSNSVGNGAAIFDSDFLDNAGTQGNFGNGVSPSQHRGILVSPSIDLTGYTDSIIIARFYCMFKKFSINEFLISISTDGGTTWTDKNIFDALDGSSQQVVEDWVEIRFPNVTAGVGNLTNVRVKFTFDGDYYYTTVDDLSLQTPPSYDLAFDSKTVNSNEVEKIILTNNRYKSISQIDTNEYFLAGANVVNRGKEIVHPGNNATFEVVIDKEISGNWNTVHQQSTSINAIGSTDGDFISTYINNFSWLDTGAYQVRYILNHPGDNNKSNDTSFHYFDITDGYDSKVGLDNNGNPFHNKPIFPGGSMIEEFEYGSMFTFNNTDTTKLTLDSILFKYYISSGYSGPSSTKAVLSIYKFIDGRNGNPIDSLVNNYTNEFVLTATDTVILNGLGSTKPNNSYHTYKAANFIDTANSPVNTLDNGVYFISIKLNATLNNTFLIDPNNSIWLAASNQIDYSYNFEKFKPELISPVYITESSSSNFNSVGFGSKEVPAIGVYTSTPCFYLADMSTLINGNTLSSNATGATYQWLNCDSNYQEVNGETNQSFNPTINGYYSVEVTSERGCIDTSTCTFVCPNPVVNVVQTINGCDSTLYNSSWYYNDTAIADTIFGGATNGCDSIAITNIRVIIINTMVTQNNNSLTALDTVSSLRWINCDSGSMISSGDTNLLFSPTINGNYAVEITTEEGCIDTSSCIFVCPNPATGSNPSVSGCDSASYNNIWFYSDTIIFDTILGGASNGCDSIASTTISITTFNLNISISGTSLTATDSTSTYRWLNCDSSYSHTIGDTNQMFSVTVNGNYAVELTSNLGCVDTSACVFLCPTPLTGAAPAVNGCDSVLYDGSWYFSDTVLLDTLFSGASNGCDSIVSTTIAIVTSLNTAILVNGNTLMAFESNANYDWVNCDNNFISTGVTTQSYTPTDDANYAVILSSGSCVDTSSCISLNPGSIDQNSLSNAFNVYPNPLKDELSIVLLDEQSSVTSITLRIFDTKGNLMYQNKMNRKNTVINIENYTSGIYMLQISSPEGIYTKKLIKL